MRLDSMRLRFSSLFMPFIIATNSLIAMLKLVTRARSLSPTWLSLVDYRHIVSHVDQWRSIRIKLYIKNDPCRRPRWLARLIHRKVIGKLNYMHSPTTGVTSPFLSIFALTSELFTIASAYRINAFHRSIPRKRTPKRSKTPRFTEKRSLRPIDSIKSPEHQPRLNLSIDS